MTRLKDVCLVLALAGLLAIGAGCSSQTAEAQAISLPMGYVANVQFSPWYVARERGYLADAGFDVTFDYRYETDGIQLVASGEIPFTVSSLEQVIQARANGLPVKGIASWYQRFPVGVIALDAIPLSTPTDLAGLTVGIPETFGASYIGLLAMLDSAGLTEEDINLQAIGYTQLASLTSGTVDAVVVYANNAPAVLDAEGIPYHGIWVSDYVSLISVGVVSSDAYINDHPEETRQFVDAFLHGVSDALADRDMAFEISHDYIEGLEAVAPLQRAVLERSAALWETPTPGLMTAEAWQQAQDVMFDAGMIPTKVPIEDLYTNVFVQPEN